MTIGIGEQDTKIFPASKPDPSILVIDEFISEEQEAQILGDLEDPMARCFTLPRLPNLLRCWLTPSV